jgi:nicotinate-nucleotide adenylyltransferase
MGKIYVIKTMKIGLYFGSFNPVHNGHMVTARTVLEERNLDGVWFVVSPKNPMKDAVVLCDENHRIEMLRLAIRSIPLKENKYEVSDVEFSMPKPSYTIDTVERIKKENPEIQFSIIMGSDILPCLSKWKNWEDLLLFNKIIVVSRRGHNDVSKYTPALKSFESYSNLDLMSPPFSFELSSTIIRERIKSGLPISFLVPDQVSEYIKKNGLFISNENGSDGKI